MLLLLTIIIVVTVILIVIILIVVVVVAVVVLVVIWYCVVVSVVVVILKDLCMVLNVIAYNNIIYNIYNTITHSSNSILCSSIYHNSIYCSYYIINGYINSNSMYAMGPTLPCGTTIFFGMPPRMQNGATGPSIMEAMCRNKNGAICPHILSSPLHIVSSLDSTIYSVGCEHMYRTTTSVILGVMCVACMLILVGDIQADVDRNVAGFQLRPTFNGEVTGDFYYTDWVSGDCWDPYPFLEIDPIGNPTYIAHAGQGVDVVSSSGLVGTLTFVVDEVGNYIIGGTDVIVANPDFIPYDTDVINKMVLVSDCNGGNTTPVPPVDDTVVFRWCNIPTEICVGEPVSIDLMVDIPASLESMMGGCL